MSESAAAIQQRVSSTPTPTPDPPSSGPSSFTLTLPTQQSQNANGSGSHGNKNTQPPQSAPNGHGTPSTPSSAVNGAGPSTNGNGNGNQAFDQAALQARISLAQQMAQAGMQQTNQLEQQHASMPQQQQQGLGSGNAPGQSQGQGHERKNSGPTPDWSQLANAGVGGMINNVQGATREALMKQASHPLSAKFYTMLTRSFRLYNHRMRLPLATG